MKTKVKKNIQITLYLSEREGLLLKDMMQNIPHDAVRDSDHKLFAEDLFNTLRKYLGDH